MSKMSEAIIALMKECDEKGLHSVQVSQLLSVLRGPDSPEPYAERVDYKAAYTAPLRLYLLGEEAYRESGYWPIPQHVNMVLSGDIKAWGSHYIAHIAGARNVIALYDIRPASERLDK